MRIIDIPWDKDPEQKDPTSIAYQRMTQARTQRTRVDAADPRPPKLTTINIPRGPRLRDTLSKSQSQLELSEKLYRSLAFDQGPANTRNVDAKTIARNIILPDRMGLRNVRNSQNKTTFLQSRDAHNRTIAKVARSATVVVLRYENSRREHDTIEFMNISPSRASWSGAEQSILPRSALPYKARREVSKSRRRQDRIR